jgi:pyruvate/2-oxoglutarate dehydrogenase complex dihydrolipoamide acyltransferase (E2) component
MDKPRSSWRALPFPRERKLVIDAVRYGKRKHTIHGLLEIDVTEPRRRIRRLAMGGSGELSFTAFVIHCLARAISEHEMLASYRDWRGRLIVFDDVDVNAIVERPVRDTMLGSVLLVRAADCKSVRDIHEEIRAAQVMRVRGRDYPIWMLYVFLPAFVRALLWRVCGHFPHLIKRVGGTVSVTAVGMFAGGGGWGIGIGSHTTGLTLGGISHRPVVVDDRIEPREILDVTLSFDHDIVDGAPGARFASRLRELIESATGLEEPILPPDTESGS